MNVVQLHQLDSELLHHAQQKAERFGLRGHRGSRFAHRSEGDPFADATPDGHHSALSSGSEDLAGK